MDGPLGNASRKSRFSKIHIYAKIADTLQFILPNLTVVLQLFETWENKQYHHDEEAV
jgi:hypothetical protein